MDKFAPLGAGLILLLQSACTSTPPLSHVTNNTPFGENISVNDVVKRVKCELADAIIKIDDDDAMKEKKGEKTQFKWLDSWTAKADLTLQVNETGGITPNVTFSQPLKNAFSGESGPSNVLFSTGQAGPTSTVTAIPQSFNLGIGATYSGQAFRTETVSFALSLRELKTWRRDGRGKVEKVCLRRMGTDLADNLDLGSWIDAALVPVVEGDLAVGNHARPNVTPVPSTRLYDELSGEDKARADYYRQVGKNAADDATKSAQQAWATLRQAENSEKLKDLDKKKIIMKIHTLAKWAAEAAIAATLAKNNIENSNPDELEDNAVQADMNAENAARYAAMANRIANPDPPVDSLSHSLNFIVTIGVSASPNWILLQWKGPANVGNVATYSGIRTHTLSIALGSPGAGGNAEANRVLNNESLRQAIQSP
jgi:hypothetical protein